MNKKIVKKLLGALLLLLICLGTTTHQAQAKETKKNNVILSAVSATDYDEEDEEEVSSHTGYCAYSYKYRGTCYTLEQLQKMVEEGTHINQVYYGDTTVTGTTLPYGYISVTVANEWYEGDADEEGNFSVKIPSYAKSNKLYIRCGVTAYDTEVEDDYVERYVSLDVTMPMLDNIKVSNNNLYKGKKVFKGSIKNVCAGDKLTVTYNGKKYTKEFKKTTSKASFKFNFKSAKVGKKIKVQLKNKYGEIRKKYTTKVYLSNKIKLGMTPKQVKQTTFGKPDKINYYDDIEEWIYDNSTRTTTVIFKKGKCTSFKSVQK